MVVEGDTGAPLILNAWIGRVIELRERARYRNVKSERILLRVHIAEDPIGFLPVDAVTGADVAAFWRRLVDRQAATPHQMPGPGKVRRLSHSTIRNVLSLLRAALTQAVAAGIIERNPAAGVSIPRPIEATTELELAGVLEAEEERALLTELARRATSNAAGEDARREAIRVYNMVRFALGAGVRRGELLSLRWSDVALDVAEPFAVVRDSGRGSVRAPAPTKGGAPRRVPLFGMALEAMRDARVLREGFDRELGSVWVFKGPRGGRRKLPPSRALAAALRAVGILRKVRWHDLRHTCATALLEGTRSGMAPWRVEAVQQLLGHTSVTTTERYLHARGVLVFREARGARVDLRGSQRPTSRATGGAESGGAGDGETHAGVSGDPFDEAAIHQQGSHMGIAHGLPTFNAPKSDPAIPVHVIPSGHAPSSTREGESSTKKPPDETRFSGTGGQVPDLAVIPVSRAVRIAWAWTKRPLARATDRDVEQVIEGRNERTEVAMAEAKEGGGAPMRSGTRV